MKRYWIALLVVLTTTFTILGFFGREVYRKAPPLYDALTTISGRTLYSREDILTGQEVWQSIGGQQIGSIWGHGAYQAPDWTADWLHRELVNFRIAYAQESFRKTPEDLTAAEKAILKDAVLREFRDSAIADGRVTISPLREKAFEETKRYYLDLFGPAPALQETRKAYAIQENVLPDPQRREKMMAFFHWTSWVASARRPGESFTYTNNWPHEPLIDNVPTRENIWWSVLSVVLLLAGIGGLVWYYSFRKEEDELSETIPAFDPLKHFVLTPSMRALWKYWATVLALFIVQLGLGGIIAHYTVEGQDFYGIALSKVLPYSLARTWHIQVALFWIATSFLAAGLFLAPIINGGKDPRFQRLGVNVLFGALLVVVVGSLGGEFLAVHQKLNLGASFWFGHQGYEYTDLGRFWQILLFAGLLIWLGLMLRCIAPALRKRSDSRELLFLFTASTVAIGLFYGGGLAYGARTHLSVMEFWRWWVVHLWVEGFFEVFTTVAIAFLFVTLGLIKPRSATKASLFSTSLFLLGGIPGTFHHLYFSGTPISISAVGACFSALEVVPLILVGIEAAHTYRLRGATAWMENYRWPIMFFVSVAFWNFVGAGLFGFLINPPIALFYMQGLNTTAVHAHGATFGVYGMLSLGLVLVLVQTTFQDRVWKSGWMTAAFWGLNGGLALMILLSLLPIGLIQLSASLEHGLWHARSLETMGTELIQYLRWFRGLGDVVFAAGGISLCVAVAHRCGVLGDAEESESEEEELAAD